MARPLRIERPGGWYHVTARGNEQRPIYRDAADRQRFCELLGETVARFGWNLHAYVLMDNHFHLLAEIGEANLGRGMQWLNVSYSVWFNRRHQRSGHLFQGRYKAIAADPIGWGLELSRYIHLNPVRTRRHGLSKEDRQRDQTAAAAEPDRQQVQERILKLRQYRWSSYRAYLGLVKAPTWLRMDRIQELGGARKGQDARQAYRRHVEQAIRQGLSQSPWETLTAQTILGGAEFVRQIRETISGGDSEETGWRELRNRPDVWHIVAAVEKAKGEKWMRFRDRYGDWGRDLMLYLGRKGWSIGLAELGEAAGGMHYKSVSAAVRRLPERLKEDRALAAALNRCRKELKISNIEM